MCNHECRYFKCRTGEHAGKYAFMCGEKGSSGCSFWGGLSIHFTFRSSYLFVIPLVVPEDLLKNPAIDYAEYDSTFMVFRIWGITIICYSAIRVSNSVPPDTTWIFRNTKVRISLSIISGRLYHRTIISGRLYHWRSDIFSRIAITIQCLWVQR